MKAGTSAEEGQFPLKQDARRRKTSADAMPTPLRSDAGKSIPGSDAPKDPGGSDARRIIRGSEAASQEAKNQSAAQASQKARIIAASTTSREKSRCTLKSGEPADRCEEPVLR